VRFQGTNLRATSQVSYLRKRCLSLDFNEFKEKSYTLFQFLENQSLNFNQFRRNCYSEFYFIEKIKYYIKF